MAAKTQHKTKAIESGNSPVITVLYARVSNEEQRERQSIQTQIEEALRQCEREGISLQEIYTDEEISGTIPFEERPAGKRLLEDARAKKFNAVLVYKVDRLGRADLISHVAKYHLETLGIGLRSLTEPFDLGTPQGQFMFSIFASQAALERSNFLERAVAGIARCARAGKWVGGVPPYGYRKGADSYLEINEDIIPGTNVSEAEVVRLIFRWIVEERQTTITVSNKLNAMGIPTLYARDKRKVSVGKQKSSTSGRWSGSRISSVLHNTTYKGLSVWGKRTDNPDQERIQREVSAIISPELWEKAQHSLRLNHGRAKRNSNTRDYLLRSFIRCEYCKRKMTGAYIFDIRAYYRCYGAILTNVKFTSCPGRALPADWIEELVWGELRDWILNHTNLEGAIAEGYQEQEIHRQEWQTTLTRMRADIALKDQERERIITAYRKGWLSSDELERQLGEFEVEKQQIEQAADDLEQRHNLHIDLEEALTTIRKQVSAFRKSVRKDTISADEKRQIIETFVKEIWVWLKKRSDLNVTVKETIPFKPGRPDSCEEIDMIPVWKREDGGNKEMERNGIIQIIYRFPVPSEPKELLSIAPFTDTAAG